MRLLGGLLISVALLCAVNCSPSGSGDGAAAEKRYTATCPQAGKVDNSPKSVALAAACQKADSLSRPMAFAAPLVESEAGATAKVRVLALVKDCTRDCEQEVTYELFKNSQGAWELTGPSSRLSGFVESRESRERKAAATAAADANAKAQLNASCLIQASDLKAAGLPSDGFEVVEAGRCKSAVVDVQIASLATGAGDAQTWESRIRQKWEEQPRFEFGERIRPPVTVRPLSELGNDVRIASLGSAVDPYALSIRAEKAGKVVMLGCEGRSRQGPCIALFRVLLSRVQ